MKCPHCHQIGTKVIESRDVASGESIRRRRECLACRYRYTTYERVERPNITVVKKDGTRQMYDRLKLVGGLQKACEKTTVSGAEFEELVANVEKNIYDCGDSEIQSTKIGSIIMEVLADVNHVAYVRFASVYRSFTDLSSFEEEVSHIRSRAQNAQEH